MVFIEVQGEDKDVVHVYNKPSFFNFHPEYMIHERLECRRGITETEEHHRGFIQASFCYEGCFPAIFWMYSEIVVSLTNVEFHEVFRIMEFIEQGGNQGKRESILDSLRIDESVILT